MRRVGAALFFAATLLAGSAGATTPPSPWDAVRDPRARERYELHVAVSKALESLALARSRPGGEELANVYLIEARSLLEAGDAARSPDAQLRFDLGRVYAMYAERGVDDVAMFRRAAELLESALALAPQHPSAEDAMLQLATSYARFDTNKEVSAYERLLAVAESPRTRAVAYLNRSEALMRLGQLDHAIEDARYAVELDASPNDTALANMDLAVELDRYGDGYGALRAAEAAVHGFPEVVRMLNALQGPDDEPERSVFFVPDYDKHWYRAVALGVLARACDKQACLERNPGPDDPHAAFFWRRAVSEWSTYLQLAEPTTPWLAVARRRLVEAQGKLAAANARAAATPHRGFD